ncbi:MAG: chemotaxis protein CheA [Sulfuricaulis sp.]|uniref:chemotaxis protein CheA n=1 Tax=Sulfuricaulis sp. TaxID=2003553 RepID=UPI0025CF744B|nr:chemotaxis protein CheA [Sulfuricaulis sp.]MCR4346006.1 chemotaxis protein CheA [Sulfuricaulis sp.]
MAIDMRQFHQTFFEESLEGLAIMETELLRLEKTAAGNGHDTVVADPEILNTIFRAAHSIKGGSSTFGFDEVAAFAHVLESRLDALRDGRLRPDRRVISLLLSSVDCLRSLIISARTGKEADKNAIDGVRTQLESLENEGKTTTASAAPAKPALATGTSHWHIVFRPHQRLFQTGNDPLRILRELSDLGEFTALVDITTLPVWNEMDPEECYLAWNIELIGPVTRETINEVFSWVVDDCTLEITARAVQSLAPRSIAEAVASMDAHTDTLRVSVPKVDALINTVGELVITQTMLSQLTTNFSFDNLSRLFAGIAQLERNTRELQESVMHIRMLPLSFAFNRLPRLVHDMSQKLEKRVELIIHGESTEIDKTVIDRLIDPLLHLVRNSLDHGIERPVERVAGGKPETGRIELKAFQKGGNVVIEIRDDGRGLPFDRIFSKAVERGLLSASAKPSPEEIIEIIFMPGFSTAETVSDVSGRGVGMDVVRNNIRSLGGTIEVTSQKGHGTCFTVRLPLTLAILDGLSVQVGVHTYIMPLVSILESVRIQPEQISRPAGSAELYGLRKEFMPLLRLYELFHVEPRSTDLSQGLLVIVEADGKKAGLYVDDLLGQQQVVIKSLATHYRKVEGISAATILGDGTVAMILDVTGLIRLAHAGTGRTVIPPGDAPITTAVSPTLN